MPAWSTMFGVTENYAAFCLIVFIVGSASGMLVGGYFADRVRRHDLVASFGLLVAAAFMIPVAAMTVPPSLLPVLLALALPIARSTERRWYHLSRQALASWGLHARFRRDVRRLWIAALTLPFLWVSGAIAATDAIAAIAH